MAVEFLKNKEGELDGRIKLIDVRASYLHIWHPYAKKETDKPAFSGAFLIPLATRRSDIATVRNFGFAMCKTAYKLDKLPDPQMFIRNGSGTGKDGYEGHWFVQARAQPANRPRVFGQRKEVLVEADGIPYSGCQVNVVFKPWALKNVQDYGKRICAELLAIQYVAPGQPFGRGAADRNDLEDQFDDVVEEGMVSSGDGLDDDDIPF